MSKKSSQLKSATKAAKLETRAVVSRSTSRDTTRGQLAADRLGEAFATIVEFWDFLPEESRDGFSECIDAMLNEPDGHWTREHELLRACLPIIFRQKFDK